MRHRGTQKFPYTFVRRPMYTCVRACMKVCCMIDGYCRLLSQNNTWSENRGYLRIHLSSRTSSFNWWLQAVHKVREHVGYKTMTAQFLQVKRVQYTAIKSLQQVQGYVKSLTCVTVANSINAFSMSVAVKRGTSEGYYFDSVIVHLIYSWLSVVDLGIVSSHHFKYAPYLYCGHLVIDPFEAPRRLCEQKKYTYMSPNIGNIIRAS